MTPQLLAAVFEPADVVLGACGAILGTCVLIAVLELRARRITMPGASYAIRTAHGAASTEPFFLSLHGLRRSWISALRHGQPWVGMEIRGGAGALEPVIWMPSAERQPVASLLRGVYPDLELAPAPAARAGAYAVTGEFALARNKYLPLRARTGDEPLASLFAVLAHAPTEVRLQLLVRPRSSRWQTAAHGEAQRLREARDGGWWPRAVDAPSPRATQFERERARAMESKAASPGFDCVVRVIAQAASAREARVAVRAVAAALLPLGETNALSLRSTRAARSGRFPPRFPLRGASLLTASELALLWHAPDREVVAELLRPIAGAPRGSERGERVIGTSGEGRPVGLSLADSRLHLHLLGATGTGKTTVLLNLAAQDIAAGRGVAVLDPKGDLVRALLERIPRARLGDVVLISPDASGRSVGINPLQLWPGDDGELVAENALTIFKRIYERYWGPRTDDVLRSALLTLVRGDHATLAQIPLLLGDAEYRARALHGVDDPLGLGSFWRWFDALSEGQRAEVIGPLLNKLREFLVRPRLRRLLCQEASTVDLRRVVDGGGIVLADLGVGRWGATTSALIGSFLVARIWQAVLARAAEPEEERRDFFLFLDEFQHFLGIAGPFADALAEARSLRLSLTIANQHLGQLTRELREAVASNARSRVVFQCGQDDASYLAREFAPLDAGGLLSLGRFEAVARIAVEGRTSSAFRLRTLAPPPAPGAASAEDVRAASMERFGRPVEQIDAELLATLPAGALAGSRYRRSKPRRESAGASPDALRGRSVRVTADASDLEGTSR